MAAAPIRILYVTWDAPEATYLESLFLPAFRALASEGFHFDVLQFRWGEPARAETIAATCARAGVGYSWSLIDRRFGAAGALKTALGGGQQVKAAAAAFGSDWLMPRSAFAGMATMASRLPLPLVFEGDGLAADERAEFGGWGHGIRYRLLRSLECRLARRALATTVRTDAAGDILSGRTGLPRTSFFTVPNGRDPFVFHRGDEATRRATRAGLGVADGDLLMVHAGSVGPQYGLDRIAALHHAIARQGRAPRLLLLNRDPERARRALAEVDPALAQHAIVRAAAGELVPSLLAAADLGLAFREESLSMRAVAPVKLAEYLLCGVPAVGSLAAGPTEAAHLAGVLLDQKEGPEALAHRALALLADRDAVRTRARRVGIDHHGLARMVRAYAEALGCVRALVRRR